MPTSENTPAAAVPAGRTGVPLATPPELKADGYAVWADLPPDARWRFTPSLFSSPAYLALLPSAQRYSYYMLYDDAPEVVAVVHFWVEKNNAYSPLRAPFGGVEMADQVPNDLLEPFLRFVMLQLEEAGVQHWVIRLAPGGIEPWHSSLHVPVLKKLGFSMAEAEVNHHLLIHPAAFMTGLHHSLRRKLNKARQEQYTFQEEPAENLAEVFRFIEKCRDQKGYQLSVDEPTLQQYFRELPESYFLFSVRSKGQIIAATIGVRLDERVFYNFTPAHDAGYDTHSPVVLLNEGLYNWAADRHYQILDLGTSALPDGPNYPLITFKERLGGVPSLRLTFQKSIT